MDIFNNNLFSYNVSEFRLKLLKSKLSEFNGEVLHPSPSTSNVRVQLTGQNNQADEPELYLTMEFHSGRSGYCWLAGAQVILIHFRLYISDS